MVDARVWLITGTSSGLGRAMAEAAAAAGDLVVATARRPEALDDLVARYPDQVRAGRLDVTDQAAIGPFVTEVVARYGRVDVLVNNAGHGHLDPVEQMPDAALRELFELHVLGPAALVRAVLPGKRARRSGAIVQMSSLAADFVFPGLSGYCASKAALETFSESLAAEVGPLGITVLIAQLGSFRTNFCGAPLSECEPMPDYRDTVGTLQQLMKQADGTQPGDPAAAARAVLTALAADRPPLRLPLGDDAVDLIGGVLEARAAEIRQWETLARSTGFSDLDQPAGAH